MRARSRARSLGGNELKLADLPNETLLRELLAEIRALRVDLAAQRRTQTLRSACDQAAREKLLPAIVPDLLFRAGDLYDHATLEGGARLKAALADIGGIRKLSRLLKRAGGTTLEGRRLECLGLDSAGWLWVVRNCESDHLGNDAVNRGCSNRSQKL